MESEGVVRDVEMSMGTTLWWKEMKNSSQLVEGIGNDQALTNKKSV